MMTVLPLWCASTLVAYVLGYLLLGPKRGFASLLMLGGFAAAALLALAGHPLPGIIVGAVSGGVCGALLVRWTGTLQWKRATPVGATTDQVSPELSLTNAAKSKPTAKKSAADEARTKRLAAQKSDAIEAKVADLNDDEVESDVDSDLETAALVTGPLKPIASARPKGTPAAKASAARSGSYSAVKTGKRSKRKNSTKPSAAPSSEATQHAALEEESKVAIGTMLEESSAGVEQTAALGTVSRAGRTMAGFDAKPVRSVLGQSEKVESMERSGRRPSSIPRGVFAMDEETPMALTHKKADAELGPAISGFDEPTENLDGEIAPTHCSRCRAECSPEARYCAGCSAPVMPWGCKECGHQNHAEADFCVRCQAPVELLASPVDVEILDE